MWSTPVFIQNRQFVTAEEEVAGSCIRTISFGNMKLVRILRIEASDYNAAWWDYGIYVSRSENLSDVTNVFTIAGGINTPYERVCLETPVEIACYGIGFYHGPPLTEGNDVRFNVLLQWWVD